MISRIACFLVASLAPFAAPVARAAAPASTAPAFASVVPIASLHAHNDYQHARPLAEALENGFASVEADVCLVGGQLLVGHKVEECVPGRTLQSLYLDPLRDRIRAGGEHVYPAAPDVSVRLLVDFKTDKMPTYLALRAALERYQDMLTRITRDGKVERRAITVVLTGNAPPRDVLTAEPVRYMKMDGSLADLDDSAHPPAADLVDLISTEWKKSFTWTGSGPIPEPERQLLRDLSAKARRIGRPLRFWGAPDTRETWKELRDAGVELINTDDLRGAADFIRAPTNGAK
jgi:hypothetical protein